MAIYAFIIGVCYIFLIVYGDHILSWWVIHIFVLIGVDNNLRGRRWEFLRVFLIIGGILVQVRIMIGLHVV